MGETSSMKSFVPVTPMSSAASSEKPGFHGRKRAPSDRVLGASASFARHLSLLGFVGTHW